MEIFILINITKTKKSPSRYSTNKTAPKKIMIWSNSTWVTHNLNRQSSTSCVKSRSVLRFTAEYQTRLLHDSTCGHNICECLSPHAAETWAWRLGELPKVFHTRIKEMLRNMSVFLNISSCVITCWLKLDPLNCTSSKKSPVQFS